MAQIDINFGTVSYTASVLNNLDVNIQSRSSGPEVFCKKGVFRNFIKFTGKHLCQNLFFNKIAGLKASNIIYKKTLTHVFSCEFCEISKNTFLHRTPLVAASANLLMKQKLNVNYYY